jgi:hypothetical protein
LDISCEALLAREEILGLPVGLTVVKIVGDGKSVVKDSNDRSWLSPQTFYGYKK